MAYEVDFDFLLRMCIWFCWDPLPLGVQLDGQGPPLDQRELHFQLKHFVAFFLTESGQPCLGWASLEQLACSWSSKSHLPSASETACPYPTTPKRVNFLNWPISAH